MKLIVPSYPSRSWQIFFGHLNVLIHESGVIERANVRQTRAVLAAAYQVRLARLYPIVPVAANELTSLRLRIPVTHKRSSRVRLNELIVFAPNPDEDFSISSDFEEFIRDIPEQRLLHFLRWYPPTIGFSNKKPIPTAFTNQLLASLARYRFPQLHVTARRFSSLPTRHLSLLEIASLTDHVFGDFVDRNTELICRLSYTADEAALLIGKSRNTTAIIRNKLGALSL